MKIKTNYKPNVGDKVILDEGFNNSSFVIVKAITSSGKFATVQSVNGGDYWTVMTYRLTESKK